jgi:hypothetical protein
VMSHGGHSFVLWGIVARNGFVSAGMEPGSGRSSSGPLHGLWRPVGGDTLRHRCANVLRDRVCLS